MSTPDLKEAIHATARARARAACMEDRVRLGVLLDSLHDQLANNLSKELQSS